MKQKFLLSIIFICVSIIVMGCISVSAASSGTCGTNLTWTLDSGTLEIDGTGDMYNWTSQNKAPWYSSRMSITAVVIGGNVTSIGDYAFYDCNKIKSITVSENNEYFSSDDGVLYNKDKTELIQYPVGSAKTEFVIPSSVISIGVSAFYCCNSLNSVTIPNSVTGIGENAFYNCSNLTEITIPDSVTSIGSSAFCYCNNMKSITVSENNKYFSSDDGVLYNKDKTELIQCPIGSSKTEFVIPSSVTNIGTSAFYECRSLKSVTIGENVTRIGSRAFYYCNCLEKINWNARNVADFVFSDNTFYNAGRSGTGIEVIFGENVETIPAYAFYQPSDDTICSPKIVSVKIGENVTSIGKYAFHLASSLTSIEIPNNVTSIGGHAFYRCSSLKSVKIGNGITHIENDLFGECSSLTEIEIPENVTKIDNGAFSNCKKLKKINWNAKNVADFSSSNNVFYNAGKNGDGIEVVFGKSVETIPAYAFYPLSNTSYSPKIVSVTIPDSVTSIGKYAFCGCGNLSTVYYNGTEADWSNNITIGSNNTFSTDTAFIYFAYITIYDKDGNKVTDTTQNMGEYVDISGITVPDGYDVVLCKDRALTESYSLDMPINENLVLYYNIVKLNKLSISGTDSADIGQNGITESVTFATDKTAKCFAANIKYSSDLSLSEIKSEVFDIEKDEYTEGEQKYLSLTCTNKIGGNIPVNTEIKAFDLIFDVSENAKANDILRIEFVDNKTLLTNDNGNDYFFEGLEKAEIKINPIIVSSITINGADEIDKPTRYTAVITPENATNNTVEWSVDNSEIATISQDGTLTPVKAGTVKIKATATDGSEVYDEKTVNVKVYAEITSLSANTGMWDKEFTPTEREYTIYVPKNASSIKLTATHNGTLKAGTKTFYSETDTDISLLDNETTLTMICSDTDCTDSTYTIKIVKFEGTQTTVSADGKSFTVKPINIEGNMIILALYNGDTLVEMQSVTSAEDDLPFETDKTYTSAKVMVWKSLSDMTPVCDVEIAKQPQV